MWSPIRSALLSLLIVSCLPAQIGGGSIVGVITDPTGAPVSGVRVLSHNQDTNEERAATTNSEGYYEFPLLPGGRYRLEAEVSGFDRVRGEVFELSSGTRPKIDFQLR